MWTRRSLPSYLAYVSLLAALGCSTIDVDADWDPGANFSELHTWNWASMPEAKNLNPPVGSRNAAIPMAGRRVETSVEAVLSGRGYTKATSGAPDFWVSYHIAIDQELDLRTTTSGYGGPYGYYGGVGAWGTSETRVEKYDVGTLLIDVIDAKQRKLIWRGTAQSRLQDAPDAQERERRILDAVTRVLERFPPPPKP